MTLLLSVVVTSTPPLHPDETKSIGEPVLLTDPAVFLKAGESYFDPTGRRIIFQAIEHPPVGQEPEADYGMYIGELTFDENGMITGLEHIQRVSTEGSANTCGWFHPSDESAILFATTMTPLVDGDAPGYQRDSKRYRWVFPPKMNIVVFNLDSKEFAPLITDDEYYLAEGSWSPDGRHIVYCSLATGSGDIYVADLQTGVSRLLVGDDGYDGGPFFSPDGKRITYRSDRRGNDLLQLYVSELAFDETGAIVGVEKEYQLTDNKHVNWGPFWHPNNRFLIYATSEISHRNYELFVCDADSGADDGTTRYGIRKRRITYADGFDGLPAFDASGKWLMWTSKRQTGTSQLWVAPFLFDLEAGPRTEEE
jgi:dipeptidyl aminopeptidase/acylaminoacyl peptidase